MSAARSLGLLAGWLADARWGDPQRRHPVAAFGSWAAWVEPHVWRDSRSQGALFSIITLAPVAALGLAAEALGRRHPLAQFAVTAASTWAALGLRSLANEGTMMADALTRDDLEAARERLSHLCGRDPSALGEDELARATIESMAENTADAGVATLFWGALAGVPGILVHRAANTLDAMVGHRSARYARFGTASARLDDALDYIPARLTGTLACLLAPIVGGSRGHAWHIMRRDAHNHPSPNGGWCESAWAGALGVQLGGTNVYGDRVEHRGFLGDPNQPLDADAVRKATALVGVVSTAAALLTAACSRPKRKKVR